MSSSLKVSNKYTEPLLTPIKDVEEKMNPTKKAAIITAIIGGIIAAFAALCAMGIFPKELLGGSLGVGITLIIGLGILIPSAYVIWKKW